MKNHVLLISDQAGYGKLALSAMYPVLSYMGYQLYNLPTALVSNAFQYGRYEMLDTTAYMRGTIRIWGELGFRFEALATGFVASEEQAALVAGFALEQKEKGAVVFTDPIMGDDGALYSGLPSRMMDYMRRLVAVSDYLVPNYTEAALLTGMPWKKEGVSAAEMDEMIGRLRELGASSVAVTSATVDGKTVIEGYDAGTGTRFTVPVRWLPVVFPGTGDIFLSVLMGRILKGWAMQEAASDAARFIARMIGTCSAQKDKLRGLPLERHLELLDAGEEEAA